MLVSYFIKIEGEAISSIIITALRGCKLNCVTALFSNALVYKFFFDLAVVWFLSIAKKSPPDNFSCIASARLFVIVFRLCLHCWGVADRTPKSSHDLTCYGSIAFLFKRLLCRQCVRMLRLMLVNHQRNPQFCIKPGSFRSQKPHFIVGARCAAIFSFLLQCVRVADCKFYRACSK